MGKGKGSFDHWATRMAISQVVFELKGMIHEKVAREALRLAGHKLPGENGFFCQLNSRVPSYTDNITRAVGFCQERRAGQGWSDFAKEYYSGGAEATKKNSASVGSYQSRAVDDSGRGTGR